MSEMRLGRAMAIIDSFNSERWTDDERLEAIDTVFDSPTEVVIPWKSIKEVVKWLISHRVTNIVNSGEMTINIK